jgi:pyridoxine 5-phosphate synthase
MKRGPHLCVNIDHIATVRQARMDTVPDPVEAARLAEKAGAIGITAHLREDRRHIQDADVLRLRRMVKGKFNLDMAATPAMVSLARNLLPDEVTLVPEKRLELTTEGGLDVAGKQRVQIGRSVAALSELDMAVSLFIDPDPDQIHAAVDVAAPYVEFHTGAYSQALLKSAPQTHKELLRLEKACKLAHELGLKVNLGHGLTYANVGEVCRLPHVEDLNIGHNIVAHACMVGMERAVKDMLTVMRAKRTQTIPKGFL